MADCLDDVERHEVISIPSKRYQALILAARHRAPCGGPGRVSEAVLESALTCAYVTDDTRLTADRP